MIQIQTKTNKKSIFTLWWVILIVAVFCRLLWGSAFPSIKIGYKLFNIASGDNFSQMLFAGMRFFLAGVLTVIFGSFMHKKVLLPKKSSWPKIAVLAFFQTALQYTFFYSGLANTTGVKSSIITASGMFFTILFSALVFKHEKLTPRKILGCVVGFAGILVINLGGGGFDMNLSLNGEGFIFISALSSAIAAGFVKTFSKKENTVMLCGWQFACGGLVLMIVGASLGGKITQVSFEGIAMLFYLAFISSAAFSLWSTLLKHNPVSKISVYGFLNPVFGVLLSAWLLNEADTLDVPRTMIALLFVVVGVLIINLHVNLKKKQPALQSSAQVAKDSQKSETNEGNSLPDEQVLAVANEVVDEYKEAFEELAK